MAEPGARLLLADDDKVDRLLLACSLELLGHEVESVANGRDALARWRAQRDDPMLLDLEMPEIDGFAVLEAMAADTELRDVAVVVTSSMEGVPNNTCVGDTVNLAARLEAHTQACSQPVLVDEPTMRALGGRVGTQPMGEVALRGKALPVAVYAVAGQR